MKKAMTITYEYGENLYVNPTNRCDFDCTFCERHNEKGDTGTYNSHLWLEREPTKEEMLQSIEGRELSKYEQLVFVGFGEPTYRIDDICWVIDQLKAHGIKIFTRIDTNGTGSLIHKRDICPQFQGRFDMVSISLNTDTAEKYQKLCRPSIPGSFEAMLDFAKEIQNYVPQVVMSVVDVLTEEEIEACRKLCEEEVGATYRVRKYVEA